MAKEKELQQLQQEIESLQNKITELDERRKSLQESENLLSIISRTTSAAIFIIQNGKICYINKAGEQLFGYKGAEISQLEFTDLIYEEDFSFLKADTTSLNPGETLLSNTPVRIKNSAKSERNLEITVVSIFFKGKIAFACTGYDITNYNKVEEVSADNKVLLKVLDILPVGVSLADAHGTILAENKIMHDIWNNCSPDNGNNNTGVYNAETGILIDQNDWILTRCLQNSEKILNEKVEIRSENFRKIINLSAIPLYLDDKELTGVIVISEDITKHRSIEDHLKQLASVIEFSEDAFVGFDLNGIITSWNRGAGKMFGYSSKEVIGTPVTNLIPAEYQGEIACILEALPDGKSIEHYETKRVKKDGTQIDISVSFSAIKSRTGKITGVSSISHDVTIQKAAAEKLRESEERFRRIFKEGPIGIAIVGMDFRLTNVNNRLCDMTGYTKAELISKTFMEITYHEDADLDLQQAEALTKGEIPYYNMDKRYVKKDGTLFWVNLNRSIVRDRNNNPLYYLALVEDITARKEAELRVVESEESYRTLARNFPSGMVFLFDHELRYRIADGCALKELGLSSEMTEGSTLSEVFPHQTSSILEPYYRAAFKGERHSIEIEYSGKIFEVITLPIKNTSGEITTGMSMVIDITERKANEEILKELITGKDKFFSIIAHDLKNPFTSLIGFAELLNNDLETLENIEIKDLSSGIYKSAKNILKLLDNLLQWSKLQSGRMDFIPGTFAVNEIIDQTISIFQPNAIRKKINLETQIDSTLLVHADKNMIDTVIRNLVSNAIKFTQKGGSVKIIAERENGYVKVGVQDNGVGITGNQIDKLFNVDKLSSTVGTDKEKGTGLGLVLCKEFIEKNSGKIWVESSPGNGSMFTFTIPASKN